MDQAQEQVRNFMVIAGQDCPKRPTTADEKTRILRVKLLLEEVLELAEASGIDVYVKDHNVSLIDAHKGTYGNSIEYATRSFPDLKEMVDALADIKYVNEGAANAFGLDLKPFFDEVHRSNMTKRWDIGDLNTLQMGGETGMDFFLSDGSKARVDIDGSMPAASRRYTVRNDAGKMIKSLSYEPADLQKILDEQLGGITEASKLAAKIDEEKRFA